jgi:hypothetical protein
MTVTLEEFMKDFTPEKRAQVEARAAELIAQELAARRAEASVSRCSTEADQER